jgi:DNA-directed RNA polymerase
MSDGICGAHHYANITLAKIDKMLATLKEHGYEVTGDNPWTIDTKNHGVVLQGSWNKETETLTVIVTAKNWYVPCGEIWKTVDPLIEGLSDMEAEEMLAKSNTNDGKCGKRCYPNITQAKIDAMLKALRDNGYEVTGKNPWRIDTKSYGVVLQGSWNSATNTLCIIVVDKWGIVPCKRIWDKIEPLIRNLSTMSEDELG